LVFNYYIFEIKLFNELKLENKNKLFSTFISYCDMSQKLYYPLTGLFFDNITYLKKYDSYIFLVNRSNKENWENFLFFKKLNLKNNYII